MIEAKLHYQKRESVIRRPFFERRFEKVCEANRMVLLYGSPGLGKTTFVMDFLPDRKAYYLLDEDDNEEEQFQRYFFEMVHSLGIGVKNEAEHVPLHERLKQLLEDLQMQKEPCFLVLDQIECLRSERIWGELLWFAGYLPSAVTLLLIGGVEIAKPLENAVLTGKAALMPGMLLCMNWTEFGEYLKSVHLELLPEERKQAFACTGGWPGMVAAMASFRKWNQEAMESLQDMCTRYIRWNIVGERKIIQAAAAFPYITCAFLAEICGITATEYQLTFLCAAGLLKRDGPEGRYELADFLRPGVRGLEGRYFAAVSWYETQGAVRAALRCLCHTGEKDKLLAFVKQYYRELPRLVEKTELQEALALLTEAGTDVRLQYLRGILLIEQKDWAGIARVEKELVHVLSENREPETAEILLNLRFWNPEMDISSWLVQAEVYTKEYGQIAVYDMTADVLSVRCGRKDLTLLFSALPRENEATARQCERIFTQSCLELLRLAELDYYFVTDRIKEAMALFDRDMPDWKTKSADYLLAYGRVLCNALQAGYREERYERALQEIQEALESRGYVRAAEAAADSIRYTRAVLYDKQELTWWLESQQEQPAEALGYTAAWKERLKAKSAWILGQKKDAKRAFLRAARFYQEKKLVQYQAEALFGAAAAGAALKPAMEALTLGMKYHYIGIYTCFGQSGYELIEQYQQLTDVPGASARRKKYYYGNILTASYEQYQSILLRCAKHEKGSGVEQRKEQLTMTELKILQAAAAGCSNQEISDQYQIKITTVKTHMYSIFHKLEVKNRMEAVNQGKQLGIL